MHWTKYLDQIAAITIGISAGTLLEKAGVESVFSRVCVSGFVCWFCIRTPRS